ncbi:hypothetical protein ACP3V3_02195 [Vibrio sp. PNB22_3_1]
MLIGVPNEYESYSHVLAQSEREVEFLRESVTSARKLLFPYRSVIESCDLEILIFEMARASLVVFREFAFHESPAFRVSMYAAIRLTLCEQLLKIGFFDSLGANKAKTVLSGLHDFGGGKGSVTEVDFYSVFPDLSEETVCYLLELGAEIEIAQAFSAIRGTLSNASVESLGTSLSVLDLDDLKLIELMMHHGATASCAAGCVGMDLFDLCYAVRRISGAVLGGEVK